MKIKKMKNSKTTKKKWEEKMKKKEPLLAVESCKKFNDAAVVQV